MKTPKSVLEAGGPESIRYLWGLPHIPRRREYPELGRVLPQPIRGDHRAIQLPGRRPAV